MRRGSKGSLGGDGQRLWVVSRWVNQVADARASSRRTHGASSQTRRHCGGGMVGVKRPVVSNVGRRRRPLLGEDRKLESSACQAREVVQLLT